MPIQIPNDLPAAGILQQENIFVMRKTRAETQHIRPLEIVLLNLMPTKIVTETQLSRLLGNTPLQVHLELMMVSTHRSKNTPQEHLLNFYKTFDELKDRKFDGMVITGAPVETMDFEQVDYWNELCEIMDFSETNVYSTLHVCWGAQAGLYYHMACASSCCRKRCSACSSTGSPARQTRLYAALMRCSTLPTAATPASAGRMWTTAPHCAFWPRATPPDPSS